MSSVDMVGGGGLGLGGSGMFRPGNYGSKKDGREDGG